MTEPASQFDPSAPLPSRHKRAVGGSQAGAGKPSLPRRWTRRPELGSRQGLWPVVNRINRYHRARVWRRRWIIGLLVAVTVVLLGAGVTAMWLWRPGRAGTENSEPAVTKGQEADHESSETKDGSAEAKDSESKAADRQGVNRKAPESDDSNPEPDSPRPDLADLSALQHKAIPALVTIYRGRDRGSGFVIEGGLVVTACHVASPGQKATVVFQDGERALVVEYVTSDATRDLAVLRTESKRDRQPLRLAASLPAIGAQVAAFKPGGGELKGSVMGIGKSEILGQATQCDMLRTTLNAVPGWSGGPVVNLEGEVVGINSRLDGSIFEAHGLKISTGSAAVPVTVLEELLAIVRLTKAIESNPNDAIHRRDRAAQYLSQGDFGKAIEDYTEWIRLQPEDAEAYCSRAKAYAEKGNYGKAAADYKEAIALKPNFVDAHRGRAAACEKKPDLDGAIEEYLQLTRLLPKAEADVLEPRLVEVYKERARARAEVGDRDKAIADLSEVIRLRPKDAEARRDRAYLYGEAGASDEAIADYTEAIRLEPEKTELYHRRGIVLAVQGEHDNAIADFTKAIQLDPKDAEAYCARGAVHGGRHDFKKAIADFTEAIRLDRWLGKAYFDRSSAYKALGDEAKAQKDFDQAKKLGYRPE
ncbi:MAG: tetratricopeptide repeat protein [Thermoguttaceae bacterium]